MVASYNCFSNAIGAESFNITILADVSLILVVVLVSVFFIQCPALYLGKLPVGECSGFFVPKYPARAEGNPTAADDEEVEWEGSAVAGLELCHLPGDHKSDKHHRCQEKHHFDRFVCDSIC